MSGLVMKPSNFSLSYTTDGGTTWLEIPGIEAFDPGTDTSEDVDVTTFSSPNNRREYRNGLIDSEEASFTVNWIFANTHHNYLRSAVGGATQKFKAVYLADDGKTGEEIVFDANVKALSRPVELEGKLQASLTLRPTGTAAVKALS